MHIFLLRSFVTLLILMALPSKAEWVWDSIRLNLAVGGGSFKDSRWYLGDSSIGAYHDHSQGMIQVSLGGMMFRERLFWTGQRSEMQTVGFRLIQASLKTALFRLEGGLREHPFEKDRFATPFWTVRLQDEWGLWRKQDLGVGLIWEDDDWLTESAVYSFDRESLHSTAYVVYTGLRPAMGLGFSLSGQIVRVPLSHVKVTRIQETWSQAGLGLYPDQDLFFRSAQLNVTYRNSLMKAQLYGGVYQSLQKDRRQEFVWLGGDWYQQVSPQFWLYLSSQSLHRHAAFRSAGERRHDFGFSWQFQKGHFLHPFLRWEDRNDQQQWKGFEFWVQWSLRL